MASPSTEMLEDELLREATVEDYQDVIDLAPGTLIGLDYVPVMFTSLVKGQGVKGYVYEKNKKVIGFLSTKLIDGGQTVMTTSGRIHPDHRGQGLYGRFSRQVLELFASSPAVRYNVFSTRNAIMSSFRHRLTRRHDIIMEKKKIHLKMDTDLIRAELSGTTAQSASHLQPLSYRHLHFMLSQPPSQLSHLFPQERILLNWSPYRVMTENIRPILDFREGPVFVAAMGELAAIGKGNSFPVTLLSHGSSFSCQQSRVYTVDIFGAGSDAELQDHLTWHLRHLTNTTKEQSAVMEVFVEQGLVTAVASLQTRFSVQHWLHPQRACFVWEANLKAS